MSEPAFECKQSKFKVYALNYYTKLTYEVKKKYTGIKSIVLSVNYCFKKNLLVVIEAHDLEGENETTS